MSLANWLLAAVGIWGLALTGAWVMYAQNSTTNGALHQNRPQMMRDFGSWDMKDFKGPQMQLETITANLSDSDKNAVETLLNQYREEEKAFHESIEKATESIKEEWEATKTSYKEKIVAITWESDEVEKFFSKDCGNRWWKMRWMGPKFDWERPDFSEFTGSNVERPELPNFENWERPEMPEMNWERPQFGSKWEMRGAQRGVEKTNE